MAVCSRGCSFVKVPFFLAFFPVLCPIFAVVRRFELEMKVTAKSACWKEGFLDCQRNCPVDLQVSLQLVAGRIGLMEIWRYPTGCWWHWWSVTTDNGNFTGLRGGLGVVCKKFPRVRKPPYFPRYLNESRLQTVYEPTRIAGSWIVWAGRFIPRKGRQMIHIDWRHPGYECRQISDSPPFVHRFLTNQDTRNILLEWRFSYGNFLNLALREEVQSHK